MNPLIRTAFCFGLILFAAQTSSVYAVLRISGFGSIDFEGTGTITHMQSPFTVIEIHGGTCTPSIDDVQKIITTCSPPKVTSLWANGVVRAEYFRIRTDVSFALTVGCPTCSQSVGISTRDLEGPFFNTLTAAKTAELQQLIDQFGPFQLRFALTSFGSRSVEVGGVAQPIITDLKADGLPSKFNPKSRGVISVALLTAGFSHAASIDVTTLRFGATGHDAAPLHSFFEDVDDDGDLDLVVFFSSSDSGIGCETLFTYVTGRTFAGEQIAGADSITTVGCK